MLLFVWQKYQVSHRSYDIPHLLEIPLIVQEKRSSKLKNEVIAQRIYPKIIELENRYRFEFGDDKPIEITKG